jgi:hypothetical protein
MLSFAKSEQQVESSNQYRNLNVICADGSILIYTLWGICTLNHF